MRRSKADQILGIRQEAAAGPLIAVVHMRSMQEGALGISFVKPRSMGNDRIDVIGLDAAQTERLEYRALHIAEELFLGCPFDHGAHQVPGITGVGVLGPWLEEQR